MSPGSFPISGTPENSHIAAPTAAISSPVTTRPLPSGAIKYRLRFYPTRRLRQTGSSAAAPLRVTGLMGFLGRVRLLDDLLRDMRRRLLIVIELRLEGAASRGH